MSLPWDLGISGLAAPTPIGTGGTATVYRCEQPAMGRTVAVKVLHEAVDDTVARRFARECRAIGAVADHPNIVAVHEAGVTANRHPYLVMQYVGRGSLWSQVQRSGPLDPRTAVRIGVLMAGALHAAHTAGVLHLDVKPHNILVNDLGQPLLADFGIAQLAGSDTTAAVGVTLAFSAPERLDGAPGARTADVYSLAATVFALIQGSAPFSVPGHDSVTEFVRRVTSAPLPDLRVAGVPDPVAQVIERATAKAPQHRYQTAVELGRAWQAAEAACGWPLTPLDVSEAEATVVRPAGPVPTSMPAPTVGAPTVLRPIVPAPAAQYGPVGYSSPPLPRRSRLPLAVGAIVLLGALAAGALALRSGSSQDVTPAKGSGSTQPIAGGPAPSGAAVAPPTAGSSVALPPRPATLTQPPTTPVSQPSPPPASTPAPTPAPVPASVGVTVARTCGASGTSDCFLTERVAPSASSAAVRRWTEGSTLAVVCQVEGEAVRSSVLGLSSRVWSRTNTGGFVANVFISGPGISPTTITTPC